MSIFGIVTFLLIGGMAFWMLLFLMGFVLPFWITLGVFEMLRPKRIYVITSYSIHYTKLYDLIINSLSGGIRNIFTRIPVELIKTFRP